VSDFQSYLIDAAGAERAQKALAALDRPASTSVRLGPKFPGGADEYFSMQTEDVPWGAGYCRILPERPSFTLDPLFHAGAYYVQDSSAMFVAEAAFRQHCPEGEGLRILDLCAAPGGKTTGMLQVLRETRRGYVVVANEVMRQRASVLAANVARWGDPSTIVTCADPAAFGRLEAMFDVIVADVPCSGEGMFRKDEEARAQWSPENVELCKARSRRIVADAWPALRDGGVLIYSTCTFNREENGNNVRWIAENLGAEILEVSHGPEVISTGEGCLLLPGFVPGEGQYCSVLRKRGGSGRAALRDSFREDASLSQWKKFWDGPCVLRRKGDMVIGMPEPTARMFSALEMLSPIAAGLALGTLKGKDFVPDADLALCQEGWVRGGLYPEAELDRETALAFLHRDALRLPDEPKGFLTVTYRGVPLGFVKNLGSRCNNLFPQGRRIRMDVI